MSAKILIISDKKDWAYSSIANAIIKYNNSDLVLSHISCKGNRDKIKKIYRKYDYYFIIGWQNHRYISFLNPKKTLVGIHSHQSFDNKQTIGLNDVDPPAPVVDYLSKFKAINTVSTRLEKIFSRLGLSVIYTPNGVDTDLFFSCLRKNKRFIVGCSASQKNDDNKGVSSVIIPACKKNNIPVKLALLEKNRIQHSKMRNYYCSIKCYICASKSEGMSLSILEAAACGCVVVSTLAGDIKTLVKDGVNGFIVDRNICSIAEKLKEIKFDSVLCDYVSKNMIKEINEYWSWENRSKKWIDFIKYNI